MRRNIEAFLMLAFRVLFIGLLVRVIALPNQPSIGIDNEVRLQHAPKANSRIAEVHDLSTPTGLASRSRTTPLKTFASALLSCKPSLAFATRSAGIQYKRSEIASVFNTVLPLFAAGQCAWPLRGGTPMLCDDWSMLSDVRRELRESLDLSEDDKTCKDIMSLHDKLIVPLLPKLFAPSLSTDERKAAIVDLSQALDTFEETVHEVPGPMMTGKDLSAADAVCFPSIALCFQTLPIHFGWEEWTQEAFFYRRPRLHSWFELMRYEDACVTAEEQIAARLQDVDFAPIAVDAPTSELRKFPAHAKAAF